MTKLVFVCDRCQNEWDNMHHGLGTSIQATLEKKNVVSTSVETTQKITICPRCSTEFMWFIEDFLSKKSNYKPEGLKNTNIIFSK